MFVLFVLTQHNLSLYKFYCIEEQHVNHFNTNLTLTPEYRRLHVKLERDENTQ